MRQTANQAVVLYFLMAAIAAVTLVGQEPPSQSPSSPDGTASAPDGTPGAISEWGLSGVVWSEANLVRKLAIETAKTDTSLTPQQMAELQDIAENAEEMVLSMERFGWKRLRCGTTVQSSKTTSSLSERSLPDPQQVGDELAESLGLETNKPKRTEARQQPTSGPVSRYDTETPAGRDDPGIDDERTANRLRIDIDHYRVDDYIDETPAEARNVADAREDGVEAAIAAANPDAIASPTAGHISYRESQTRSATMPYSQDSIYDADDYDPDVDYDVNHPLTERKMNRPASEMLDGDDDISVRKPAIAAEGEDEMLAAMERGGTADPASTRSTVRSTDRRSTRNQGSQAPRYNVTSNTRPADADWVQLHLELNESRWFAARDSGLNYQAVRAADSHLKTTIESVRRASDSSRLQALLEAH